ncbi:transposase [Streptococcus thermophilus]|uniref:Transposase n=1 Tax=Streptococcus thermophilus TaxID=1308 RepID=A0A7U7H4W3_STRTR|nr:ISSpn1, transposase, IS3 family, truncated [Streptococcus thermophilus CNRZ1066]ATH74985.1 hypothetical protein CG712_03115 [Streptococcus thermophilus]EHE87962.1 Transposase [Streptococcus thermophilus CNCM I-1630]ELW74085.1 hypothetical protein IQ7_06576 [Streptococcus thermophilus MTCC 5461]ELW74157.1 hypothetical protein IQ5_06488 [Streptococcus thermophilus MTCC 5460]
MRQGNLDYIDYYNNKCIKVKLKGLNPVQYRAKSFAYINCLTFWGQYRIAWERFFDLYS